MQTQHVVELNQENFREVIESSMNKPVLFFFWAPMSQESVELLGATKSVVQRYADDVTLCTVDCQAQQAIAAQFGVQALPTAAMFIQGQPVDGIAGAQPIEAIEQMLAKHLPSPDEKAFTQATAFIAEQNYSQAEPLLQSLPAEWSEKGPVKLALADCAIASGRYEEANQLLAHIPLEYQDGYYTQLISKLELHEQAANSPELALLEQQYTASPTPELALELAGQYHEVNRHEEALETLWQHLGKDLNALDGEMKKSFMDMLNSLGQGNPLTSQYRRQLYSLLY